MKKIVVLILLVVIVLGVKMSYTYASSQERRCYDTNIEDCLESQETNASHSPQCYYIDENGDGVCDYYQNSDCHVIEYHDQHHQQAHHYGRHH